MLYSNKPASRDYETDLNYALRNKLTNFMANIGPIFPHAPFLLSAQIAESILINVIRAVIVPSNASRAGFNLRLGRCFMALRTGAFQSRHIVDLDE